MRTTIALDVERDSAPISQYVKNTAEELETQPTRPAWNWLNVQEVYTRLGVTKSTLYEWWATGYGPRYAVVGRNRFVQADWLDDYMYASEAVEEVA